jgi:hypothetical protein
MLIYSKYLNIKDELRIYNGALTPAQVINLAQNK